MKSDNPHAYSINFDAVEQAFVFTNEGDPPVYSEQIDGFIPAGAGPFKTNETADKSDNRSLWRKLLPSRITERFFRHFLSLFIGDPDILKSCAKGCSWVLWSFFCLSLLGTVGVDTKPLLSLLR
jgi:hypothetical protein